MNGLNKDAVDVFVAGVGRRIDGAGDGRAGADGRRRQGGSGSDVRARVAADHQHGAGGSAVRRRTGRQRRVVPRARPRHRHTARDTDILPVPATYCP